MRLGYDAALWEDGGVPEALDCRWGELSAEQQALAAALGYEQEAGGTKSTSATTKRWQRCA